MTLTWADIRNHLDCDTPVTDSSGNEWKLTSGIHRRGKATLYRCIGNAIDFWAPKEEDPVSIQAPPIPEPPDGTRLEWTYNTDVYAAWRNDASSDDAGWPSGDGGYVWCVYPGTVPVTWSLLWLEFGESLRGATILAPSGVLDNTREEEQ